VAEATPRVHARLAGLRGGGGVEPPAPTYAPVMAQAAAMAAVSVPQAPIAPTAAARPRSIASALVPWAGARAGASAAASVAVRHAYGLRSGEASIMRRAPMALTGDLWRADEPPGGTQATPPDPRWRMWRDASAALVAFALVGLVFVGGDLLRLPAGPPPSTPGLAVAVRAGPSSAPKASEATIPDPAVPQEAPVLTTPTPGPVVTHAPVSTPAATPPLTGPHTTPRPTPKPTPKPTPRPTPVPLQAGFICPPPLIAGIEMTCQLPIGNGPGVTYQWSVGTDLDSLSPVSTASVLHYTFATPDFYYVQLVVSRGGKSAQSYAAFDVGPAVP